MKLDRVTRWCGKGSDKTARLRPGAIFSANLAGMRENLQQDTRGPRRRTSRRRASALGPGRVHPTDPRRQGPHPPPQFRPCRPFLIPCLRAGCRPEAHVIGSSAGARPCSDGETIGSSSHEKRRVCTYTYTVGTVRPSSGWNHRSPWQATMDCLRPKSASSPESLRASR